MGHLPVIFFTELHGAGSVNSSSFLIHNTIQLVTTLIFLFLRETCSFFLLRSEDRRWYW